VRTYLPGTLTHLLRIYLEMTMPGLVPQPLEFEPGNYRQVSPGKAGRGTGKENKTQEPNTQGEGNNRRSLITGATRCGA